MRSFLNMKPIDELSLLIKGLRAGDRSCLSRAITQIESKQEEHQALSDELLTQIAPQTERAIRIGITGLPGAGKSTFIDALGLEILEQEEEARIAVLAIDPSSNQSKGSIMADKTRMLGLAKHTRAYIRPSPHGMATGGMSGSTQEAILLCEAAGYTHIFIETVGVGQSEIAVRDTADIVLLVIVEGLGDQLQAMKRGILEIADMIIINKAEGSKQATAARTAQTYKQMIKLIPSPMRDWNVAVVCCSSIEGTGIKEIRAHLLDFEAKAHESGYLKAQRAAQQTRQFQRYLSHQLTTALERSPLYQDAVHKLQSQRVNHRKLAQSLLSNLLKP